MLILKYWSLGHFISIFGPILMIVGLYFLLRKRKPRTQWIVVFSLIILNFLQHVLKAWFWYPLYHGVFDFRSISFYNVCASMILLSPVVFLCKSKTLKDAMFFLGNLAGIMSLWFISIEKGINILSTEFIRYFFCHAILMVTSSLPVLLGLHTLNMKNFWKVCLCFFALEAIVIIDNMSIYLVQSHFDWAASYKKCYEANELFIYHAPNQAFIKNTFGSDFKMKYVIDDGTCFYIPILYSAPVQYPLVTGFVWLVMKICTKIKLNGRYLCELWPKKEKKKEPEQEKTT